MAKRNSEEKDVDIRRDVPDIDRLPQSAALTTKQTASLSGFSEITLKKWRAMGEKRGPRVIYVDSYPRYLVRYVREWLGLPVTSQQMGA